MSETPEEAAARLKVACLQAADWLRDHEIRYRDLGKEKLAKREGARARWLEEQAGGVKDG